MSSPNTSQPSSRRGGIRAMPKLKRGIRSGIGTPNQNSSSWQQQLMANPLRQNQIKALEEHGITDVNGIMGSVIPGLKRSSIPSGKGKNTKKRMRGGGAMNNSFLPSQKPARLCRVCCQTNVANFKLAERPDLIRALEFIIDLKIDIADDKESGMPSVICRKCCTVVITFDQFKRSVEEGQRKLETIMEKRRIRKEKLRELQEQDPSDDAELIEVSPTVMYTSSPSGEATVSPGVITSDGIEECIIDDDNDDMDADAILPNLECEVEINEDPDLALHPMNSKGNIDFDDIETNSIKTTGPSLLGRHSLESTSSSTLNERESDKLECDLAEFETAVIGEELGTEDVRKYSGNTAKPNVSVDSNLEEKLIVNDAKVKTEEIDVPSGEEVNPNPGNDKTMESKEIVEHTDEIVGARDLHMNGNDPTQIKDGENNDANATYEANIGVPGVKDEGDAEETIGEDIDLSLLHEDDDAADSDLERSNDDTEAIKLLNEDDDAFESFLEGEGSSSDNLIGNSGENTAIENNDHNMVRHSLKVAEDPDSEHQHADTGLTLDNEANYENEEDEIDDEMEGEEFY